jgi:uncharacterized membrane protein YqjE
MKKILHGVSINIIFCMLMIFVKTWPNYKWLDISKKKALLIGTTVILYVTKVIKSVWFWKLSLQA